MNTFRSCNEAFVYISEKIKKDYDFVSKPRGLETKEIINLSISVSDPYDRLIINKHRKISLKYLVGEFLWYERGSDLLDEICFYSKFWEKLSNDSKTVNSCYGKRIYFPKKESQWERAKNELIDDKDTRRAILIISRKEDFAINSKDVPCTMFLQFLIRNDKLILHTYMRSNDLVLGFTYDVAIFTLWQEKMLLELKRYYPDLSIGNYYHNTTSMHVYDRHFDMVDAIVQNPTENFSYNMPRMQNLEEMPSLIENEKKIRNKHLHSLEPLEDEFMLWCQDKLINENES